MRLNAQRRVAAVRAAAAPRIGNGSEPAVTAEEALQ